MVKALLFIVNCKSDIIIDMTLCNYMTKFCIVACSNLVIFYIIVNHVQGKSIGKLYHIFSAHKICVRILIVVCHKHTLFSLDPKWSQLQKKKKKKKKKTVLFNLAYRQRYCKWHFPL